MKLEQNFNIYLSENRSLYIFILNKKYLEINSYLVSENMIEIISKDINKSKSIKLLAEYLNLKDVDIYTIGDGYSDISMIKDYNGYAMKDSVIELKKVANNEYESVSDMIKDILNGNI